MDTTENTTRNESAKSDPAAEPLPATKTNAQPDAKRASRSQIVLAVLFLVIAAASVWTSYQMRHAVRAPHPFLTDVPRSPDSSPARAPIEDKPDYAADIRRYTDAVSEARDRHASEIRKYSETFLQGLHDRGPRRFEHVRAAIPFIRDGFAGFRPVAAVVRDGALDKVRGGDHLQERFNAALEKPFIQPCARASAELLADCETLLARLDAEAAAFREEVAAAGTTLPELVAAEFPTETLEDCISATYGALEKMPVKVGATAGVAVIDGAMIPKAICNLVLRCSGKTIGKAAASAVAPAADGPSPIMDLVSVGGFVWTCYDIHELMHVLPEQIENNLTATVDAVQTETLFAIEANVSEATDAYLHAIDVIASAAIQSTQTL